MIDVHCRCTKERERVESLGFFKWSPVGQMEEAAAAGGVFVDSWVSMSTLDGGTPPV